MRFDFLPKVLPAGWWLIRQGADGAQYVYQRSIHKMFVIVSAGMEQDGRRWLHVSVSKPPTRSKNKMPSYNDLRHVKEVFVGRDRKAIEVHAPAAEHVNLHTGVRHLWSCLDGDPLPDFTQGTGMI